MTIKQKYQAVINSMAFQEKDETKGHRECYLIKDDTTKEVKDFLIDLVYDDNIGGFSDLSYEIVSRATDLIGDYTLEQLQDDNFSVYDTESDFASVYTADRLAYLNMNNQDEISDKLKEYTLGDIQTACAVWYDEQVKETAAKLIDFILS